MKAFLKLIRIQNLLIIVLVQFLIRYTLIIPIIEAQGGYTALFGTFNFVLLVFSTVFLTAAGYTINDYFDTKTDMLNRPNRVIVGKQISRRNAMTIHIIFTVIGIILGFYISYKIHLFKLGYIYLIIAGLLWFYSTNYKRNLLVGNILVAFLTALVPLMPVLYEIPLLNAFYRDSLILLKQNFNNLFFWTLGFSAFAFITTLTREIIKDTEDFEGDSAYGRKSLPITVGIKNTKIIVISLISVTIIAIIIISIQQLTCSDFITQDCNTYNYISIFYILLLIIAPNILLILKVLKAQNVSQWHTASNLSKIIMLLGIFYTFIIMISLQ